MSVETALREHYAAIPVDAEAQRRLSDIVRALDRVSADDIAADASSPRRRWRAVVAAAVAVVLLAVGVAWLAGGSASRRHAPRPAVAAPSPGVSVTTLDSGLTLRHPRSWTFVPGGNGTRGPGLSYLTDEPAGPPCTTTSGPHAYSLSCPGPVRRMTRAGVAITFRYGEAFYVAPHTLTGNAVVAGYPAEIHRATTAVEGCPPGSTGSQHADVLVRGTDLYVDACFAGPDARTYVRLFDVMLASATSRRAPALPAPTAVQRARLIRLASQLGTDGGPITSITAVHTTERAADRLTGYSSTISSGRAVWVLQVTGRSAFVCSFCKGPATPSGRVVTTTVADNAVDGGGVGYAPTGPQLALVGAPYRLG